VFLFSGLAAAARPLGITIRMPFYPYLNQLSMPIYESILASELRHLRYSNLPTVKNPFISYSFLLDV
jgi:hypothetical protein